MPLWLTGQVNPRCRGWLVKVPEKFLGLRCEGGVEAERMGTAKDLGGFLLPVERWRLTRACKPPYRHLMLVPTLFWAWLLAETCF